MSACYSGMSTGPGGDDGVDSSVADGGEGDDGAQEGGDDEGGAPEQQCLGGPDVGPKRLTRLTRVQFDNTIRDLLGIEGNPSAPIGEDEQVGPFAANTVAPVSGLTVEQYKAVAEDLALTAANDLSGLVPCDPSTGTAECAGEFIADFGLRAYRRPLSADETSRYVDLYASSEDFATGIRLVIQSMLQSPHLIYMVEFGDDEAEAGITTVAPYELASRLSYFLWNSMPDDALFDAAAAGGLHSSAEVRAQAERMLEDAKAAEAIGSFHIQWLEAQPADNLDKDPTFFPAYDAELGADMLADLAAFADFVIRQDDGRLETLFTTPYAFTDGPLLELYGVTAPPGHVVGDPIPLPANERAGLLTHPAVMAVHAHANQTSPVARGALVRENLLCQLLPPPPPDVDNTPPTVDGDATLREQYAMHRDSPACNGCHVLIDGIGFGFEAFDGEGRYRALEAGRPVDASGELTSSGDSENEGIFDGAIELSAMLAQNSTVQQCVSAQWLRFALARETTEADDCSVDFAMETFSESDYNIRELILAIVSSDAFRYRQEVTP